MKWKTEFTAITLDLKAYRAELDRYMKDWVTQAAQAWLHATVIAIIPTWSKASRATFQALAHEVGMSIPYGPLRSRTDREGLGLASGDGGLALKPASFRWHFWYQSSLRYLAYNEYNKAVFGDGPHAPFSRSGLIHPTPYRFQEAGAKEFGEFARHTQLPNPFNFLKRSKVK